MEKHAIEDESCSSEELSSDEELQLDFTKGKLKPGLITRAMPPKTYTNNVSGLQEKLELLRKACDWLERMDITPPVSTPRVLPGGREEEEEEEGKVDPEDDFKREMHFYNQAQSAVVVGLRKLEELGVPTKRPADYFAEMVKTDDHMRKVRESLLSRQKILEQKEKARKMRELKKYGKKVQQEILQKRRHEKKAALEAVKKFRKGKGERPGFLARDDDDDFPVSTEKPAAHPQRDQRTKGKSMKRQHKDKKFGLGGKKRGLKKNTADSSANMSSFSGAKHSRGRQSVPQRKKKGVAKRPGKARRQGMKLKK